MQRITILLIMLTGFACSRNQARINGWVEGGADQTISMERLDVNRTIFIDSTTVGKDGSFSFRVKLDNPELYVLRSGEGEIINILLAPGDQVSVRTSEASYGRDYQVTGSDESERIKTLVEHLQGTRNTIDSLLEAADALDDQEGEDMKRIMNAYAQAIIKQKRYTIRYIVDHGSSLSSVYALYQKYDPETLVLGEESDLQYFKVVADSVNQVYPNSSLTMSLLTDIKNREAQFQQSIQLEKLMEMAGPATGMLDLSIPDRDGDEVTLSSFKGKVILLAFWASGNSESVASLLQLKPVYEKYHEDGFEIYAVSLDTDKVSWMSAVDFNEFDWINVSELSFPDSRADLLYNVTALPTTFLLNREGDIVAKNLYGRTLGTWLDNLI